MECDRPGNGKCSGCLGTGQAMGSMCFVCHGTGKCPICDGTGRLTDYDGTETVANAIADYVQRVVQWFRHLSRQDRS
jgi:hypothetical protein